MKKQMKLMAGILGLTSVLASCGTAPSDYLGELPTISGKLSDYTQGAKVLKVSVSGATSAADAAVGTLNADGSFSVILPTPNVKGLVSSTLPTCLTGKASNSAPDAKTGFAISGVFDNATTTTPSGSLARGIINSGQPAVVGAKEKAALHFYSDKESTITFENCNVSQGQSTATYDGSWILKAGWNVVYQASEVLEVSTTSPASATKTKISIGVGASGLDWRLEKVGAPFRSPFAPQ